MFPSEKPGVCPLLLLLATVWGKPALEAQGPRLTSDCSRGIYERERGREERLKPEALAPPSPAKVGGTLVARAFVERSCGFFRTGDCGLSMEQDLSQQRLALALGNVEEGTLSKCPMRWHNPPFLHLLTPSPVGRAGGVLKSCHDGFWGSWFSMPGPVSIQGDCQGQAQLWQWP